MQHIYLSDLSRVTRDNQVAGGNGDAYQLEDGSVFVVNPDGEGRHYYDDRNAAEADFGGIDRMRHVHSSNVYDN